jgi:hypothetical protein
MSFRTDSKADEMHAVATTPGLYRSATSNRADSAHSDCPAVVWRCRPACSVCDGAQMAGATQHVFGSNI